ncbi:MAG TPA: hypothetical protein VGE74_08005 [Gemmata sp.]
MNLSALAGAVLPYLVPVLPALVRAGANVTDAVRKTLTEAVGAGADIAAQVWEQIVNSPDAAKAAQRTAEDPNNAKKQAALELEIEELLKANAGFATKLAQLLEAADQKSGGNRVTVSGAGAVGVGGNARDIRTHTSTGQTTVTGNVVGSAIGAGARLKANNITAHIGGAAPALDLATAVAQALEAITAAGLPGPDAEEAQTTVTKIQAEVAQPAAPADASRPGRLKRWLGTLTDLCPAAADAIKSAKEFVAAVRG